MIAVTFDPVIPMSLSCVSHGCIILVSLLVATATVSLTVIGPLCWIGEGDEL